MTWTLWVAAWFYVVIHGWTTPHVKTVPGLNKHCAPSWQARLIHRPSTASRTELDSRRSADGPKPITDFLAGVFHVKFKVIMEDLTHQHVLAKMVGHWHPSNSRNSGTARIRSIPVSTCLPVKTSQGTLTTMSQHYISRAPRPLETIGCLRHCFDSITDWPFGICSILRHHVTGHGRRSEYYPGGVYTDSQNCPSV